MPWLRRSSEVVVLLTPEMNFRDCGESGLLLVST
jgi:hypothetical protein